MHLSDGGEPLAPDLVGEPHQRRPQSAVHESELPADETKATHVGRVGNRFERSENLTATRMAPPAPTNRLTSDRLGKARHRPARRHEHDAVLFDECNWIETHLRSESLIHAGCRSP